MILLRLIDRFGLLTGTLVSFLIWVGIVVLCWEVVARYVFGAPTIWAHGYTQRIFGAYFVLLGAYTLIRRDHVRIDLFINGPRPRVNAALDLVNYAFLIIWGVALTYEGFWFFEDAWRYGDLDDSVLQHPMWPIKFCLFAGGALISLQASAEAVRSLILVVNPQADAGPSKVIQAEVKRSPPQ